MNNIVNENGIFFVKLCVQYSLRGFNFILPGGPGIGFTKFYLFIFENKSIRKNIFDHDLFLRLYLCVLGFR